MKRLLFIMSALVGGAALAEPPDIDAASVSMTLSGKRTATIKYRLTGAAAVVTFDIEHRDSEGVWSSIGVPIVSVTGDVNRVVQPDASTFKEIKWKARDDWPDQMFTDGSIRAKVTAWAKGNPPDYMVLDLDTNEQTFYVSTNALPYGGLTNPVYRTSKLVMRRIPAAGAAFVMGQATNDAASVSCAGASNPPCAVQRWVSFTNDYYMAIYETTQGQHKKLRGNANSRSKHSGNELPVDGISYVTLRGKVSDSIDWPTTGMAVGGDLALFRTNTGIDFDIPTEAEWEFACRAGTTAAFHDGSEFSSSAAGSESLVELAWYKGNCPSDEELTTSASAKMGGLRRVGLKKPNAWGLYDMYGNASEWCKDYAVAYDTSEQPTVAPSGADTDLEGKGRVKRGGNWYGAGAQASSAVRRSTTHIDWSLDDSSGGGSSKVWANGYRLVCPAVAK